MDQKLHPALKAALDPLTASNPALARRIEQAVRRDEAWRSQFPGGFQEAKQLAARLEEVGGFEAIETLRSELQQFGQFDEWFTAGDPRFLSEAAATPEGQAAIVKLAPQFLDKMRELHPEGYNFHIGGILANEMMVNGVTVALQMLQHLIPADNARAQQELQKLIAWHNGIAEWGKKTPKDPQFVKPQGAPDREAQLRGREQELTRSEWIASASGQRRQTFETEWSRLSTARKPTETQAQAIRELYISRMKSYFESDKALNQKLQRYFDAGDQNGYLRALAAVDKAQVPQKLAQAFDAVMGNRPGPKPGTSGTRPGVTPPKPDQGYSTVDKAPKSADINFMSPFTNIKAGKAMLTDGKKVQWAV